MIRVMRTRDRVLVIALTAYLGFALACGGGTGEDNNDGNNPTTNNATSNNMTANNMTTPPAGSTLTGSYSEGLELVAEGEGPHYTVSGTLSIDGGDLVIEAGTIIEFEENSRLIISENSSISADGAAEAPIILRGTTQSAGHWFGVRVDSTSQKNNLNYVTIAHAGGDNLETFSEPANLLIQNATMKVTNSTFTDSDGFGIAHREGSDFDAFENNTFENNNSGAVATTVNNLGELDGGSTYNGVVWVEDGETSEDATWPAIDSNYEFASNISVESGVITLEPGVQISVTDSKRITFGVDSTIIANGTMEAPIRFYGKNEEAGYWLGIRIDSKSTENSFDYVTVEHGGNDNLETFSEPANVLLYEGRLKIKNSTFANSEGFGLTSSEGSNFSEFSNNAFNDNASGALYLNANNLGELDNASTYNDPVHVEDGEVTEDATWPAIDSNYAFIENVSVESAEITIEAGADFEISDSKRITFDVDSAIIADGTMEAPIRFYGKAPEVGYWTGMRIDSKNGSNLFNYVSVEHAGGDKLETFSEPANVLVHSGRLKVNNSTFASSGGYGIADSNETDFTEFNTNLFENNNSGAMHISASNIGELDNASTYNAAVVVSQSDAVTNDQTWPAIDSHIEFEASANFEAGTQTLEPGLEVRFASGQRLNFREDAVFVAEGTSEDPIVIRGTTEAPGFWAGLAFFTKSTESRLSYVTISHAGSTKLATFVEEAAISLVDANLRAGNVTVTETTGFGIFVDDSSVLTDEGGNNWGTNGVGVP